jgi:hypothetical protein
MADTLFLTASELGSLLRVSSWWIKSEARKVGGLPSYKAGKRLVFDPAEALAWFRSTCRRPAGPRAPTRRPRRQRRDAGRPRLEVQSDGA